MACSIKAPLKQQPQAEVNAGLKGCNELSRQPACTCACQSNGSMVKGYKGFNNCTSRNGSSTAANGASASYWYNEHQ